jgi:hypothetical protein
MKKAAFLLIFIMALTLTATMVNAQEKVGMDRMRIGFGAALGKEIFPQEEMPLTLLDFPSFYIPIIVAPSFRIEPHFGIVKYSGSDTDWEESYTVMDFGVGLFFLRWYGMVDLYFGARIGMMRYSYSEEYTWDTTTETYDGSRSDLYLAPAFGGEYFFTPHLSLGGEIQFNYVMIGDWDEENGSDSDEDVNESLIKTKTLFFIRWYL